MTMIFCSLYGIGSVVTLIIGIYCTCRYSYPKAEFRFTGWKLLVEKFSLGIACVVAFLLIAAFWPLFWLIFFACKHKIHG